MAEKLLRRYPTAPSPGASIAIKRNQHELEVDVGAEKFAEAFAALLCQPNRVFGGIVLKRPAHRVGAPFELGERFHGCFQLSGLLRWLLSIDGTKAQLTEPPF
jgi:hypothetical protein